jgi:hypothetical protein
MNEHTDKHCNPCSRGAGLQPFVVTALVQLICRTTKLCWFDDDVFKSIVDDAKSFLEQGINGGSPAHFLLGLKILNMLVSEFNQPTSGKSLTQHRKLSVAFRDNALLKVFQMSLQALHNLQTTPGADEKIREQVWIGWFLSGTPGCDVRLDYVSSGASDWSDGYLLCPGYFIGTAKPVL